MTKKRIIISVIAALALLVISGGVILGMNRTSTTPERLISLGEKYLSELNYEQALVQFLKVIEIEPMNPRGYVGAAEAYIGLGQTDKAIEILEQGLAQLPDNEAMRQMLEGLRPTAPENANEDVSPEHEEWTNLNGMPTFNAEYITDVLGYPAKGMTIYDIPNIDAEVIALFEEGPETHRFSVTWEDRFYHWEKYESGRNGFRIARSNDNVPEYLVNEDGTMFDIQFYSHMNGINVALHDVLNSFRIDNPEVYEFMKDPVGYWDDKEPFESDPEWGDRYHLSIYDEWDDGGGGAGISYFPDGSQALVYYVTDDTDNCFLECSFNLDNSSWPLVTLRYPRYE